MITLIQYEEVHKLSKKVPILIDLYEKNDVKFIFDLNEWLVLSVKILEKNNFISYAKISTYRGKLLSSNNGFYEDRMKFFGKPTKRKLTFAVGVDILHNVSEIIYSEIETYEKIYVEAEKLTHQILNVLIAKSTIERCMKQAYPDNINCIKNIIEKDNDLISHYVMLKGMVHKNDISILLDRGLEYVYNK